MSQYDFPGSNQNIAFRLDQRGNLPDSGHNCLDKAVSIDMRRIASTGMITYVAVVECAICSKRRIFEFKEEMD